MKLKLKEREKETKTVRDTEKFCLTGSFEGTTQQYHFQLVALKVNFAITI